MTLLGSLMIYSKEEDSGMLEQIYKKYKNRMFYTAILILKEKQEAENVVHDTFLVLANHLDQITDTGSRKTWNYIVTILKNKCIDQKRKQSRIGSLEDETEPVLPPGAGTKTGTGMSEMTAASAEEQAIAKEMKNILTELILELKYPYKEVLYLQYYNNLNSRQIGEILALKPENVRKISGRARQVLKKRLTEMGYGND